MNQYYSMSIPFLRKLFFIVMVTTYLLGLQVSSAEKTNLTDNQKKELVADFCYAIQASGACPDLSMRLDTEAKVKDLVGSKFRAPDAPYTDACMEGLTRAIHDESKEFCQLAWQQYGCRGNKMPTLLYQAQDFCKFKSEL